MKLYSIGFLCLFSGLLSASEPAYINLLEGDSDFETSASAMTSGCWIYSPGNRWRHDVSDGFRSTSSLEALDYCGLAVRPVKLPPGTYTFSFYAKSRMPDAAACIAVNPTDDKWDSVLKRRAEGRIVLGKEWKRYSVTFHADGTQFWSPYYGIDGKGSCHFDRFMLNAGEKPAPWSPSKRETAIAFPKSDGNVFPIGMELPVSVSFFGPAKSKGTSPVRIKAVDWTGKTVYEFSGIPEYDSAGTFVRKISLPKEGAGWFLVTAESDGKAVRGTALLARPPEKLAPGMSPFTGLCGATRFPETAARLGVRWAEVGVVWGNIESRPGIYDFSGCNFSGLKKLGYSVKVLISPSAPVFRQTPEVQKLIREGKAETFRMLPPENELDSNWRTFIRELVKRHGKDIDIFELGGELDALIGLNTYYKSLAPDHTVGPFVTGPVLDRVCRQIDIAIEEILRAKPDAVIATVRPSDVDARYAYLYSRAVFAKLKYAKKLNIFGIDCYPQPRWIAADQPATGTEQDLRTRFHDASAAMKQFCGTGRVFISEYGYFLDNADRFNLKYQQEQANRLARSFLMARHLGFESLFYFYVSFGAGGLEANRFAESIWEFENPHLAAAALSTVAAAVENVTSSEEIKLSANACCLIFRKNDGRALAAVWSLEKSGRRTFRTAGKDLRFRDMLGNTIPVPNGVLPLTENPVYLELSAPVRDSYSALKERLVKAEVQEDSPLSAVFRPAAKDRLKVYLSNSSGKKSYSGTVDYPGGKASFSVPPAETAIVSLPLPAPGSETVYTVTCGGFQPYERRYAMPELFRIPRVSGLKCGGSLKGWEKVPRITMAARDRIMPLDHTNWTGPDDLSASMYLAHDGTMLYFAMEVRDDLHFNKFSGKDIWRGDSLQVAFDPLTNHISGKHEFDPDDVNFVLALADGKTGLHVVKEPGKGLEKQILRSVVRDEKTKTTLYQFAIPLQALSPAMQPGRIFGLNAIVFDDDTNGKADYWLFFKPGLGGRIEPEKFGQFILEE